MVDAISNWTAQQSSVVEAPYSARLIIDAGPGTGKTATLCARIAWLIQVDNPIALSTGKRGRPKQSKATNLIGRLRDCSDDVWRFMTQADVPFTNNLAPQTVRMPKVKQKVSVCFRTLQGAQTYCVIRSYCATMHKQGANIFEALVASFKGAPPQPSFG